MNDSTFNAKKASERPKKEKSVQSSTVDYARGLGFFAAKVDFPGYKGASDYIFIKNSMVFFIEFKRPKGGRRSPMQERFAMRMAKAGILVHFAKTKEEGKAVIGIYVNK